MRTGPKMGKNVDSSGRDREELFGRECEQTLYRGRIRVAQIWDKREKKRMNEEHEEHNNEEKERRQKNIQREV